MSEEFSMIVSNAEIIQEKVIAQLGKAQSTSVDGTSITNRSISDFVQATELLGKLDAKKQKMGGIVIGKVIPPNALGQ